MTLKTPAGRVRTAQTPPSVPDAFSDALRSLQRAPRSPHVRLTEIPAPGRSAPFAVALTGEFLNPDNPEDELADGRFILLHEPSGRADWSGRFRVVSLFRAELEPEMGADPLLSRVAWSWLIDSLHAKADSFKNLDGTVTRVLDQHFGSDTVPETDQDRVELEVRASWTPASDDIGSHLVAWTHFLATIAGRPPLPEGVIGIKKGR